MPPVLGERVHQSLEQRRARALAGPLGGDGVSVRLRSLRGLARGLPHVREVAGVLHGGLELVQALQQRRRGGVVLQHDVRLGGAPQPFDHLARVRRRQLVFVLRRAVLDLLQHLRRELLLGHGRARGEVRGQEHQEQPHGEDPGRDANQPVQLVVLLRLAANLPERDPRGRLRRAVVDGAQLLPALTAGDDLVHHRGRCRRLRLARGRATLAHGREFVLEGRAGRAAGVVVGGAIGIGREGSRARGRAHLRGELVLLVIRLDELLSLLVHLARLHLLHFLVLPGAHHQRAPARGRRAGSRRRYPRRGGRGAEREPRGASRDTRGEHRGRAGACGSTESLRAGGAGTGVGRGATSTAK